jgi:hypothetical protein
VLNSSDDHDLNGKPVHETVSYIKKKQLTVVMPGVYKLAVLMLTIPSTTASVGTFLLGPEENINILQINTLSGLALISIEKQLLHQLRHNPIFIFQEAVLEKFNSQARRMEFT